MVRLFEFEKRVEPGSSLEGAVRTVRAVTNRCPSVIVTASRSSGGPRARGIRPGSGGPGRSYPQASAGSAPLRNTGGMCRSIKTLRPPALPEEATEEEIRAAALQYVRKVSGFRAPAAHNREVFERAVDAVAEATAALLSDLQVRGQGSRQAAS
ncbi:hypothetical protein SLNWT_5473 [Streptomyces albus]|uniref:DUF2277 domain-containing protein n=2 Tax=Streptomyces TaxID=1883 RepID=A0A0B5EVQ8_STRA4|nr:hypothetical protein SLNWT_5473 [Streptomyces albus]AOU80153.1 hypothetical protein SLNHY_5462 [Streptomyces albus]